MQHPAHVLCHEEVVFLEFRSRPQNVPVPGIVPLLKQFRPSDPEVFARHAETFPPIDTLSVETDLGGWEKAQEVHFADGGLYDKIMAERR